MSAFEDIRPYYDTEVNQALLEIIDHPMLKAMMNFTFPDVEDEYWKNLLRHCHSIRDFQINFIYPGVKKVLEKSSEGLSTSGFEKLEKNKPYLFISNHRDIILDTSILNACLFENGLFMTTSAIGDNLVKKPFLKHLSRLTRNFVIKRGLQPRELLQSSQIASAFIKKSILRENRSVWIAQREGRTKDGNDLTNKGVLKMIGMAADEGQDLLTYLKQLNIVPVSISYEYDPTDVLKMPELMAKSQSEPYVKAENEDFINLLNGIIGQKKRIHFHVGEPINEKLDEIALLENNANKQIALITQLMDDSIQIGFKLWPCNYVACDLFLQSAKYKNHYSEEEKHHFIARMEKGIDTKNTMAVHNFLAMYANPVINHERLSGKINH
jgi:1-acyl-sn-glycerol-3-phosphate acyltransferase